MNTAVSARDYNVKFTGYTPLSGQKRFGYGHAYSGEQGNLIISLNAPGFREAQTAFKNYLPPTNVTGVATAPAPVHLSEQAFLQEPNSTRFVRRPRI